MPVLTLPLVLTCLSVLSNTTTLLSKMESSLTFQTAWNANLDLAVAMSRDPNIDKVLSFSNRKMLKDVVLNLDMCEASSGNGVSKWALLKDVKIYLDRSGSPTVLFTVLEKLLHLAGVQTIVKDYPELQVAFKLTKLLVAKITENFGLNDTTQAEWTQLVAIKKNNFQCKHPETVKQNCSEFCAKNTKFPELLSTDEQELNRLFEGVVPTSPDLAMDFLQIGFLLRLPALKNRSSKFLEKVLFMQNVVQIYQLAIRTGMQDLKDKAEEYILFEFEELSKEHPSFTSLKADELLSLLVSDKLTVTDELSVFQAVVRWVQADPQVRKVHTSVLMKALRLHLCSHSQLTTILEHELLSGLEPVKESLRAATHLMENKSAEELSALSKKEQRHLDQTLFVVGGVLRQAGSAVVESFSPSAGHWVAHQDLNNATVNGYTDAITVGQKILMFVHEDFSVSSLDPVTREWRLLTTVPDKRTYFSLAELDGLVYVLGGFAPRATGLCQTYDPSSDVWTRLPDLNSPRSYAAATVLKGKIYIGGGSDDHQSLRSVEVYDPSTNAWTLVTPMNVARQGFSLVAEGDRLWAVGGDTPNVETYDLDKNSWTITQSQTKGVYHKALYFTGNIYAMGRVGDKSRVDVFNPRKRSWSQRTELTFLRYYFGGSVVHKLPNAADYV